MPRFWMRDQVSDGMSGVLHAWIWLFNQRYDIKDEQVAGATTSSEED